MYVLKKEMYKEILGNITNKRDELCNQLTDKRHVKAIQLASEKGASCWLTVLPMSRYGFSLDKRSFRDGIALRYGWRPDKIHIKCACGKDNDVEHALSCRTGGYPILRHNTIRNNLASLLREVCTNVSVEPSLQSLSGETFSHSSCNREDGSRLDVAAGGFFGDRLERTFFDVRVFNPYVRSNDLSSIEATYRKHEEEKRRKYEERVINIERSSFVPFVMSCTGGYARAASESVKRIASMLSEKKRLDYATTISWIRAKMNFSLIRSCITALRGARNLKDMSTFEEDNTVYIKTSYVSEL